MITAKSNSSGKSQNDLLVCTVQSVVLGKQFQATRHGHVHDCSPDGFLLAPALDHPFGAGRSNSLAPMFVCQELLSKLEPLRELAL